MALLIAFLRPGQHLFGAPSAHTYGVPASAFPMLVDERQVEALAILCDFTSYGRIGRMGRVGLLDVHTSELASLPF